jgi:hypothetical protein
MILLYANSYSFVNMGPADKSESHKGNTAPEGIADKIQEIPNIMARVRYVNHAVLTVESMDGSFH